MEERHPPPAEFDPTSETLDAALKGAVRVVQPRRGYRFSVDALLLAAAAPTISGDPAVDVGTGCGIVALLLAHMNKAGTLLAVEAQEELAALADRNVRLNALENRVRVIHADVRDLASDPAFPKARLILANPPFFARGRGRENADPQVENARREHFGTIVELVAAMRGLMDKKASLAMVYGVERLAELFAAFHGAGLVPKHLRLVHGRPGLPARLALIEAQALRATALQVAPPLFLENADGSTSAEAKAIYEGRWP